MATAKVGQVSHSWFMSEKNPGKPSNKQASVNHYVTAASVTAYNAAADDAARAATAIGLLFAAENALTKGVSVSVSVGFTYVDSAAFPPAASEFAYPFDKIGVSFRADGESYVSSIPARVTDNAIIGISGDGVNINIGVGVTDEIEAYIEAFNAVVLSEEQAAVTIAGMNVKS
jgi:hypothetical protein